MKVLVSRSTPAYSTRAPPASFRRAASAKNASHEDMPSRRMRYRRSSVIIVEPPWTAHSDGRARHVPSTFGVDAACPAADDRIVDDDLDPSEAARNRRRDRDADAEARDPLRPGMGKV